MKFEMDFLNFFVMKALFTKNHTKLLTLLKNCRKKIIWMSLKIIGDLLT